MDLILHIPDEAVPALKAKASGLPLEVFAAQVLLERIHDEEGLIQTMPRPEGSKTETPDSSVAAAAPRLGTFGKRHGLSLGGITIRELLDESRP